MLTRIFFFPPKSLKILTISEIYWTKIGMKNPKTFSLFFRFLWIYKNITSVRTLSFRLATYILLLLKRQQKGPIHCQHALLWEKFQDRKSVRPPASGVQVCACDFQTDATHVQGKLRAKRVLIEIAGPLSLRSSYHHSSESWSNEKMGVRWCTVQYRIVLLAFCKSNYKKENCPINSNPYTECPTNMLTTSNSIFHFLKPHISKSKTCFENPVKKSFR